VVTSYRTVARAAEAEIEVKRSRFLCRVAPVRDEDAARAVVEEQRKRFWDARHHCSAFVLGPDAAVQRSNDDGEPSGTAGAPMLEVLRGQDVSDVDAGRLENGVRSQGVTVLGVDYGAQAVLHLAVPADEAGRLPRLLAELSGGELEPAAAGSGWVDA
jgi:hypothetical protein